MSARPHRYDASSARESRASSSLCEARTHRASSARSRLGHPRSGRSLATCVQCGWHRGTARARTCERASSERARHGSKSADARSRAGCVRIHHLQSFAQHAVDRDPQYQDDAVSVDDRERVLGSPAERLGAGLAAVEPRVESRGALHALISCVTLHPQTLVFDRHTGWGPLHCRADLVASISSFAVGPFRITTGSLAAQLSFARVDQSAAVGSPIPLLGHSAREARGGSKTAAAVGTGFRLRSGADGL